MQLSLPEEKSALVADKQFRIVVTWMPQDMWERMSEICPGEQPLNHTDGFGQVVGHSLAVVVHSYSTPLVDP